MSLPVPPAPAGYPEPSWKGDDVDVFVVIDRSDGFEPFDRDEPLKHPIDVFVGDLRKALEVLRNMRTLVNAADEIKYREDVPTQVHAVVTNDERYADWCRSWGGNLVEVDSYGSSLVLTTAGESHRFEPDDFSSAVRLTTDACEGLLVDDDALDSGDALLQPITLREFAGIEPILHELWRAAANDELDEAQRLQISALARMLEHERSAIEPTKTERWRFIGALKATLRYLARELPMSVLAWWKIAELLVDIEWSTLASELPK